MKTTKMTPFFHLLFLLYLLVTFISEFENTLNSFSNSLLWSILVCKLPIFLPKILIWTAHHTFPESRHPEVTKTQYYVLFTHWSKIRIFLGSSSWTILEVEENFIQSLSAFLLLFVWQKEYLLRAFLTCTFISLLMNSFDLCSYNSKSRKIYIFRLLCCWCV